jgi:DNA mismatch endonuclease (patch repair protein)
VPRYPHPEHAGTTRIMRANRRVDTGPESAVRSWLHRAGYRFRKDVTLRVGSRLTRPDIVFPRLKLAVFIDGCFWHGCPRHGTTPRHNAWYWTSKLDRNRARDVSRTADLRRAGWVVRRYWEHEPAHEVAQRVAELVRRLGR